MNSSIYHNSNFSVRQLTKKHSLSIKNIWRECFTPDNEYINTFLQHCFPYSISWGLFPNNSSEAIAMLSLLPSYSIIIKNNGVKIELNGSYVYGVGTLEHHRGKGYSKILMDQAIHYSKMKSLDYMLVKPAQDSLFDLYEKQSFNHTLSCYSIEIDIVEMSKNIKIQEFAQKTCQFKRSYDSLSHMKARESNAITNFLWPVEILNYSLLEIGSRGGVTAFLSKKFNETSNRNNSKNIPLFYSAYTIENNALIVKVTDHNIMSIEDLKCVIDNITTSFLNSKKIQIEFAITINPDMFSALTCKRRVIKNALIKILNPDSEIESMLLKMHLTQSME